MQAVTPSVSYNAREVRIPVPWGNIAVKEYGPSDGIPLLGLHGWQDNAGTFDLLQPYIPSNQLFVSVDLPGHGWSSHRPLGTYYHNVDYVEAVKRVIAYYNWEKFSVLAHSMGGGISLLYASIYPKEVDKVILFDTTRPGCSPAETHATNITISFAQQQEVEEKLKNSPKYYSSAEEAHDRWVKGTKGELSMVGASVLARRGLQQTPHGYMFTRDLAVQVLSASNYTPEALKVLLSNIRCHLLVIRAMKQKDYGSSTKWKSQYDEKFRLEILETYKKNCSSFKYLELPGTHYIHLEQSDVIGPIVKDFLTSEHNSHL